MNDQPTAPQPIPYKNVAVFSLQNTAAQAAKDLADLQATTDCLKALDGPAEYFLATVVPTLLKIAGMAPPNADSVGNACVRGVATLAERVAQATTITAEMQEAYEVLAKLHPEVKITPVAEVQEVQEEIAPGEPDDVQATPS